MFKKNRLFCKTVLVATFFLGICVYSFGQIGHGGTPYSFGQKTANAVFTVVLPQEDNLLLLQEEMTEEKKQDGYQFGKEIAVDYQLTNAGVWEDLSDGGRLWRLGIESKGAYSLNLIFEHFHIPSASHLFIYTADKSFVLGSFTAENNNRWGNFATTLLPGDALVLEFYEAAQDRDKASIHLSTVVHGYKDFFFQKNSIKGTYGTSGSCNVNINCKVGDPYQDVKRAVALVLNGSSAHCSGTLINNTKRDNTPYFLTASHVLKGGREPSDFVFIFNYETADCNGANPTQIYSVNGATVVAASDTSDFALLLLNDKPPIECEPYYAGWNRKDMLYKEVASIHHPNGDWKKISIDRKTVKSGKFDEDDPSYPDNTHYIVVWDTGTTQKGSSGSGLFNKEKLLIGQLEGGFAGCYSIDGEDMFGKFSYSWTNNNHPDSNRLDYWLDPIGSGVEFLAGMEADPTLNVINPVKQADFISIYPNPTHGKLKVESGERKIENLIVYDIIGRKIIEVKDIQHNEFILDMEKLHTGLYIMKIESEERVFIKKIIKR